VATSALFVLAMLGFAGVASPAAALAGDTIIVTTTIQAAVDAAQPGDTILVPPGTYRESVLVNKSHLTITGSPAAVIDAEGFPTGIRVGTGRISRLLKGNTAGIHMAVLPDHPRPFTDDVVVERNQVVRNNLPNPVPADSGDEIGGVPTGVGIVNLGSDHVVVRSNRVLGNDSLGVIVLRNLFGPADPRIEPDADFNQVRGNVVLQNGRHPDPVRAITPGADIVYDGTGTGNCFANNIFATDFPAGITASFPCGN
jgi:nitrous oxidase accessory protein NosD